jgi:hypothetical protein
LPSSFKPAGLKVRQNPMAEETKDNVIHTIDGIRAELQQDYMSHAENIDVRTADIRVDDFRDPYLQMVVSSRMLRVDEVAKTFFKGDKRFILHRMVFRKMFAELLKVFKSETVSLQQLNERDHRGNTILLLAAKMAVDDDDYLKCVNFLFKNNANGKLRDANGWSLLDEAIGQGNARLLAVAFDAMNAKKKEKIESEKRKVLDRLKQIPDFYTEIHWECQSSWIPFLSKIAPSDTFQIWKIGSFIRLDFSLVGFSKLQSKRRRMSILCRDHKEAASIFKSEESRGHESFDIVMVNKDRKIVFNVMEDLDIEEKLAVLTDIMNADPVQNELNIVRQEWSEVKSIFGNELTEVCNGYQCQRHKVTVEAQVKSKKKVN